MVGPQNNAAYAEKRPIPGKKHEWPILTQKKNKKQNHKQNKPHNNNINNNINELKREK